MKNLLLVLCLSLAFLSEAQNFEIGGIAENYRGYVGDLIKVPIQLKNTSNRSITLIVRKAESEIGTMQKSFLCPEGDCRNSNIEDFILHLEPGASLQNFIIGLEAGLVPNSGRVKYIIYNRSNPGDSHEIEILFSIEERPAKNNIFTSRFITIHDVYPNPVTDFATIEYRLLTENVKAKIVIHNILGIALSEHPLPYSETRVKLRADEFTGGVYFYSLYLDNEGVMTRKLIVKR